MLYFRTTHWLPSAILSLKHWIAIRKIGTDGLYFDLDSHLPEPQYIGKVRFFIQIHPLWTVNDVTRKDPLERQTHRGFSLWWHFTPQKLYYK